MTTKNNGGSAFPIVEQFRAFQGAVGDRITAEPGMTLRDYFAAHAMAMIARHRYDSLHDLSPEPVAHYAYALADAMIAERDR